MRKPQKQNLLECVESLRQAHDEIKKSLQKKDSARVQNMLSECQSFAISIGETIEKSEGEGHSAVTAVEGYCEELYRVSVEITGGAYQVGALHKRLQKQLFSIENSIKNDIKIKKEVVFFPYKASMWDSLESIYLAAKDDPDCDAYCVPIPYYDRNPDGSFGQMHYEGFDFPEGIPITDWQAYRFEELRPDMMYICNPYDDCNFVTSVHPRFYSRNLKPYTDCLVYVPYYSTTGGMSEGQRSCPAYASADYIVIQAPLYRDYFDKNIPERKFLPMGSPKFDRMIHKCQNPPEPPAAWKAKMDGKRVFFYNTSLNGMLAHTRSFLKKMEYVFSCFEGRDDVCILWRPHPLMEATFASMRPGYLPEYHRIRDKFLQGDYGIYDTTPEMTNAIAYSDAYIGDSASSVLSVFGIVGKPIFVLNNEISCTPDDESWRGAIMPAFNLYEQDRFSITQGNKLYESAAYQYDYHYVCDLSAYAGGWYYSAVFEIGGKRYVCPGSAQDILVIADKGIEKKITLDKKGGNKDGAFAGAVKYKKWLVLFPFRYPALVLYDTETDRVRYLEDYYDVYVQRDEENAFLLGGICLLDGVLYCMSPTDERVVTLDIESGKLKRRRLPVKTKGCIAIYPQGEYLWLLPYEGYDVIRWNPKTDEILSFLAQTRSFRCIRPFLEYACDRRPFQSVTVYGDTAYLTPWWGTEYLKLDIQTKEVSAWRLPYEEPEAEGYYFTDAKSCFLLEEPDADGWVKIYCYPARRLYRIRLGTDEYEEIPVRFDVDELRRHEPGFDDDSQWLRYVCKEDAFNSLTDLLDGTNTGKPHDAKKEKASYGQIAANNDGTCGQKIHEYIKNVCSSGDRS